MIVMFLKIFTTKKKNFTFFLLFFSGFDCSIWQGTTYTDTVAQCWKNKNAQFVSIGSINRSGKGIETRTNPYLKAMVDRSWNIVKAKRVDVYIFLTKGRDWYKQGEFYTRLGRLDWFFFKKNILFFVFSWLSSLLK